MVSTAALVSLHPSSEVTERLLTFLEEVFVCSDQEPFRKLQVLQDAATGATDEHTGPIIRQTPLRIQTRYYNANVLLRSIFATAHPVCGRDLVGPTTEALIILAGVDSMSQSANCLVSRLCDTFSTRFSDTDDAHHPNVRILAVTYNPGSVAGCAQMVKDEARSTLLNWALDNGFELLFPFVLETLTREPVGLLAQDDAAVSEKEFSVRALTNSLECHMWASMEPHHTTLPNKHLPSTEENVRSSIPTTDGSERSSNTSSPDATETLADPVDQFDQVFNTVKQIRDRALRGDLSDAERREAACRAMTNLLHVFELHPAEDDAETSQAD